MTNLIKCVLASIGLLKLRCKNNLGSTCRLYLQIILVDYTLLNASPQYEDTWLMEINMFPNRWQVLLKNWVTSPVSKELQVEFFSKPRPREVKNLCSPWLTDECRHSLLIILFSSKISLHTLRLTWICHFCLSLCTPSYC